MVHLGKVTNDSEIKKDAPGDGIDMSKLGPEGAQPGDFGVYGSRFAEEDLPRHGMPEDGMPSQIAYRMIKDDLTLDGNPTLNLASFCTTYMEPEAEQLMMEALSKNFIDYEEYPVTADIQNRCVNMIARLFNIPTHDDDSNAMGTSTVGSSEAIMLATLAMKKTWVNKRKAEGKDYSKPNIIMNSAVQAGVAAVPYTKTITLTVYTKVCWEKAARYFDVEEKYVYYPKEAVDLIDENTIGICSILGTTYTGEYEDTKAINDLLVERNLDIPIHVDAASGGFVAPFVNPDLIWDFRLEKVVSINASGHKYGLVYPGVGWCVWRDPKYLPTELIFNINYLGADQASLTLNFSRGASQVLGQYYQLIRLGKKGYRSIMFNLTRTADYLAASVEKMGFLLMSQTRGNGLPLVAFRLNPDDGHLFDEFAIAHQLRQRGWVVPAYTMAPHSEGLKMMRVVVREDFSRSRCDALIADIKLAMETLGKMDEKKVKEHKEHIKQHATATGRSKKTNEHYSGEKHSLQGKTGKTHAVC
ncbi:glutamate decarboxylase [Aureobasidium subglaciale]|nr:glutamate decarboxylase [Aureobasidium subglaciale]